jgi:hypothetical protein
MADIPREVLSEHFQEWMQGRVLKTAAFLTYCLDPGFFEQEVLPVFLDVPLSHEPAVRLVQLEDAIRERVEHLAVYYDPRGVVPGATCAQLDVRRIPVSWRTGFFHPKNALLLVEDEQPNEETGERDTRLLVASMSANLTRQGWWENVEAGHIEEVRQGEKTSLRPDLLNLISRVKAASAPDEDHSALDKIRRFVAKTEQRLKRSAAGVLHPRLYVGVASDSERRESVPAFLEGLLRTDLKLNLEVISPYFDSTADAGPLRKLIETFKPKETRVFLPLGPDGKALCAGPFFDAVRKLPDTYWGKLPADLLKSGPAESAAPRRVHAKVYRFFSESPKYEAIFVGSANLTSAGHSEGGNLETGFLIEPEMKRAPDWWLAVDRTRPTEFLAAAEDEGLTAGIGIWLAIRYSWNDGTARAYWDRTEASPVLSVEAGLPLFTLGPLPPREWRELSPDQAGGLGKNLRSTSLLTVKTEGQEPATILIQEEGMAQKPSILLNLTVADILRCWASLSPEHKETLLAQRYEELVASASPLVSKPLGRLEIPSFFDAFAGIFHAFGSIERRIAKALTEGRAKEVEYLLFGKKYDSLPRLLDRVLDEEKEGDPVNRYVLLLCARQVVDGVRNQAGDKFRADHRDHFRALEGRLAHVAEVRHALAFPTPAERDLFLDWFEKRFLPRAEPIQASQS